MSTRVNEIGRLENEVSALKISVGQLKKVKSQLLIDNKSMRKDLTRFMRGMYNISRIYLNKEEKDND